MAQDCIFCSIARGQLPAYVVYRGHGVLAILDKYPVSKGHTLVLPEEHYEAAHTTPPDLAARVWLAATAIAKHLVDNAGAPGANIVTNIGAPAGQVIFHFHVHVIPRWQPATGFWTGRHQLTQQEAQEVLSLLQEVDQIIDKYMSKYMVSNMKTKGESNPKLQGNT